MDQVGLLKKKKVKISSNQNNRLLKKNNGNIETINQKDLNILSSAKDSVRANMLVRAYRIRGHLISNLDPLGLQKERNI